VRLRAFTEYLQQLAVLRNVQLFSAVTSPGNCYQALGMDERRRESLHVQCIDKGVWATAALETSTAEYLLVVAAHVRGHGQPDSQLLCHPKACVRQ
jgi:hypothetical protein